MRAAGICHSVGFIDGTLTWMLANLPLVLGHEVAGVVSDIGPDVAGFELGDRIAAFGYPLRDIRSTEDSPTSTSPRLKAS